MRRKAQAAMEFLMTYGWAILVVLAAIGALAYLGILNPANWVQGRCDLQSDLRCSGDVVRTADGIFLDVLSSEDIVITAASYTDSGTNSVCDIYVVNGDVTLVPDIAEMEEIVAFDDYDVAGGKLVGGRGYTFFIYDSGTNSAANGGTCTLDTSSSGELAFTFTKGNINVPRTLTGNLVNIKLP